MDFWTIYWAVIAAYATVAVVGFITEIAWDKFIS